MSHNSQVLQFDNLAASLGGDALKPARFDNTNVNKKAEFSNIYSQSLRQQQQTKNAAAGNAANNQPAKDNSANIDKNKTHQNKTHQYKTRVEALKKQKTSSKIETTGQTNHTKQGKNLPPGKTNGQVSGSNPSKGRPWSQQNDAQSIEENLSSSTQQTANNEIAVNNVAGDPFLGSATGNSFSPGTIMAPLADPGITTTQVGKGFTAAGGENQNALFTPLLKAASHGAMANDSTANTGLLSPQNSLQVLSHPWGSAPSHNQAVTQESANAPLNNLQRMQTWYANSTFPEAGDEQSGNVKGMPGRNQQMFYSAASLDTNSVIGDTADTLLDKNPNKHRDFLVPHSSLNQLAQGQRNSDAELDAQHLLRQESAMFKGKLFTYLHQEGILQNSSSAASTAKLAASHYTQLSQVLDDVSAGDLNINGVKDSLSVSRQPSNSIQSLAPAFQMTSALNNPAWSNEVGQRVVWMFQSDLQQAQLQLNPKHLGPLEIKISLTADQQVNVNFLTQNASVKEALDQTMPRLREAFEQNGLNLSDVNVQQESPRQKGEQQQNGDELDGGESHLAENVQEEPMLSPTNAQSKLSTGIVDFYA